eukprot:7406318-Alexandrium_andersonii.AAC.1
MWQHAQSLPSADTVVDTRVEVDVNMVQGGPGTGGGAVPLKDEHPSWPRQTPRPIRSRSSMSVGLR